MKIIEDETCSTEFQESFKKYVASRRPQFNLFNEYDFDYCNSKDELLVQLADLVGGSINRSLIDPNAPDYIEILKGKILRLDEFPSKKEPYWGSAKPEDYKYNSDIYMLSVKCANDFITKHNKDETDEKRVQVAFLRYVLSGFVRRLVASQHLTGRRSPLARLETIPGVTAPKITIMLCAGDFSQNAGCIIHQLEWVVKYFVKNISYKK